MFFAAETGANNDVESIMVTREASHTKHRQHAPSPAKVVPPLSTGKCPLFFCLESQCLVVPLHLNLKNSQMALLVGTAIPEQRRTNFMFFATIKIWIKTSVAALAWNRLPVPRYNRVRTTYVDSIVSVIIIQSGLSLAMAKEIIISNYLSYILHLYCLKTWWQNVCNLCELASSPGFVVT